MAPELDITGRHGDDPADDRGADGEWVGFVHTLTVRSTMTANHSNSRKVRASGIAGWQPLDGSNTPSESSRRSTLGAMSGRRRTPRTGASGPSTAASQIRASPL